MRFTRAFYSTVLSVLLAAACADRPAPDPLGQVASRYVELATALMRQDQMSAAGDSLTHANRSADTDAEAIDIAAGAEDALRQLSAIEQSDQTETRRKWLEAQLSALAARARQQKGVALSIDDELRQLFGATAPVASGSDHAREQVERLLPGNGDASVRLDSFESRVVVPRPRLPAVFQRALAECRTRTHALIDLPPGDGVTVRYVVDAPWSGFSAYQGNNRSLVSVNTSYPLTVDRVLQLACHEGYPGHHVINLLRDAEAQVKRPELAVAPLFTPDAFETEAIATRAMQLVFRQDERVSFERDVLFPLAGLDQSLAETHVAIATGLDRMAPAIGVTLARFLSGDLGFVEAGWMLQRDALMRHPQATLDFARRYRVFSLAYSGATLARQGIASEWLGTAGFPVEPVIISTNGHHPATSSHRR